MILNSAAGPLGLPSRKTGRRTLHRITGPSPERTRAVGGCGLLLSEDSSAPRHWSLAKRR